MFVTMKQMKLNDKVSCLFANSKYVALWRMTHSSEYLPGIKGSWMSRNHAQTWRQRIIWYLCLKKKKKKKKNEVNPFYTSILLSGFQSSLGAYKFVQTIVRTNLLTWQWNVNELYTSERIDTSIQMCKYKIFTALCANKMFIETTVQQRDLWLKFMTNETIKIQFYSIQLHNRITTVWHLLNL